MANVRRSAGLGRQGEDLARSFLEQQGYRYVARNWHCRAGELDLIMLDNDEIVFVEVKTRFGDRAGRAEEAVSRTKSRKILTAGEWYITTHREYQELYWRCDLVAITFLPNVPPVITHFINAFVVG